MKFILFFFLFSLHFIFSQSFSENILTHKDYYYLHFLKHKKHFLRDTLFEKTIWRKKVSHLVIESNPYHTSKKDDHLYRVTLLMIQQYPDNVYSHNYPIYYEYNTLEEAQTKFIWLDQFLNKNGIARVSLNGSKIIKENIILASE